MAWSNWKGVEQSGGMWNNIEQCGAVYGAMWNLIVAMWSMFEQSMEQSGAVRSAWGSVELLGEVWSCAEQCGALTL